MENNIDFTEGKLQSMTKWFFGTYKDESGEYSYTLIADWNEWDDWIIDEIMWDESAPENEDEVTEMITQEFNDFMYG